MLSALFRLSTIILCSQELYCKYFNGAYFFDILGLNKNNYLVPV